MAISFVNSAQQQNTTNTDLLVINIPASVAVGDILIAFVGGNSGSSGRTWTKPSDGPGGAWTKVIDQGVSPSMGIFYYTVGSGEPASYTFTSSVGSMRLGGTILAYRGALWDTVGTVATNSTQTANAIVLSEAASTILAAYMVNDASVSWATPPTDMASVVSDSDATNGPSYNVFSQSGLSAGTTGTKTSAPSGGSNFASILVGLKPNDVVMGPDRWGYPFSNPVWQKRGLGAAAQQAFTGDNQVLPTRRMLLSHSWLSEPVRQKPGLSVALQQAPSSFVQLQAPPAGTWYANLQTPVWQKPGLTPALQQFYATDHQPTPTSLFFGWYTWFAEPVRSLPVTPASLWPYQAYAQAATQNSPNDNFAEQSYYSKYAFAWSEPVRILGQPVPGLHAALQQFVAQDTKTVSPGGALYSHTWLSTPVWQPVGTPAHLQQTLAFYPLPYVNYGWPQWLSEPVRIKPGLNAALQQTTTGDTTQIPISRIYPWYSPFNEPVRLKVGLRADLQQWYSQDVPGPPLSAQIMGYFQPMSLPFFSPWLKAAHLPFYTGPDRLLPTPTITVTMLAPETNSDVALFGVLVYDSVTPTTNSQIANVSIIEIPAISGGLGAIRGD